MQATLSRNKLLLALVPVAALVLVASLYYARTRSSNPSGESSKAARPENPNPRARPYFSSNDCKMIVNELRRDAATDPTLVTAILAIDRDSIMELNHLTTSDRASLWDNIQKLQAELKQAPPPAIFEVKDK